MTVSVIDNLLEVQEKDCEILDMERELHDIPARKELEQSRLAEHDKSVTGAEEELRARNATLKEIELEIEARQEKIAKLRQQQLEIKTNKEFKAVEAEIKTIEDNISGIEDRELELMGEIETANAALQKSKESLEEERGRVAIDVGAWDERAADLEKRLEEARAAREESAKTVDPEWLSRYDRIFASKKDRVLVALADGVCSGCHMRQPPYVIHDTRKRMGMVTCSFCARLLY